MLVVVAAMSIGISKAGFSGVSLISVFILADVFGAKASLGVALPMLIVADLCVYPAFRKYGNWREVWELLWPTFIGMGVAIWVLAEVSDGLMRKVIGAIILLMVMLQLYKAWKPKVMEKLAHAAGFGLFAGLAGGLATVLANAAGPIQQLYLLSKDIPKMDLIGIGARFFLVVNFIKIPLYKMVSKGNSMDLINQTSLLINLCLVPAIVLGVWGGKKLLYKVPQKLFERLIVVFALTAAVRLLVF